MAIATLLDPRYKRDLFSCSKNIEDAERIIKEELLGLQEQHRPITAPTAPSAIKGLFSNRHKFRGPEDLQLNANLSPVVTMEYDQYIDEAVVEECVDPLKYWKNELRFPKLRILAQKYLIIMGTSVPSERLFSQAANIITLKRNRLTAESLSKFLFISKFTEEDFNLS